MNKVLLGLTTLGLLAFVSCQKETSVDVPKDAELLVSQIILKDTVKNSLDTTVFTYKSGKLVAYKEGTEYIDSIKYDGSGRVVTFVSGESGSSNKFFSQITYLSTSILKVTVHSNTVDKDTVVYSLSGNNISTSARRQGWWSASSYDSTLYSYDATGDVIKSVNKYTGGDSQERITTATITYANAYKNIWNGGQGSTFWTIVFNEPFYGASKLPSTYVENYNNLTTYTTSFSVNASNNGYPTSLVYVRGDLGYKQNVQISYINK